MPLLIFPITGRDLWVDVRVNHNAPTLATIRAAGITLPASMSTKALVDTGSDITVVSPVLLKQLGIPPFAQTITQGIIGSVPVNLYRVSLWILDEADPQSSRFVQPDLIVMEMPSSLNADVLIGMDVLLGCRMILDGPARQFTLEF